MFFIQDASQYVLNQMEALEAEQNHVDNRAGVVERKLRQLLETGDTVMNLMRDGKSNLTRVSWSWS